MDSPSKLRRNEGTSFHLPSENIGTLSLVGILLVLFGGSIYLHGQSRGDGQNESQPLFRTRHVDQNRSEFFLRSTEWEERFPRYDFTLAEPDDDFGQLEPMWRCEDPVAKDGRKKKLIFNHIFKTAGSTMRAILQAYSVVCHTGIAVVVGCTSLSLDSINNGTWKNGIGRREGDKCKLKQTRSRDGGQLSGPLGGSINTRFLENYTDILAGHLPMGSDYGWKDKTGVRVESQYIVFLRDGVRKYVSGILFKNSDKDEQEIVNMIKKRVRDERKAGKYYEKYSSYLTSPEQSHRFREMGIRPSLGERVNLTMSNMIRYNVLVGIVERMSESLEILRFVIDEGDDLRGMFEYFGMASRNGTVTNRFGVVNKSKLSSSKIVEKLEKDPAFMEELKEYVKYDDMIRDFGLQLHMKQYEYIKRKKIIPS